jgi:hypothetical protein
MIDVNKPLIELWDQIKVCHDEEHPAYFKPHWEKIYLDHNAV